MIFLLYILTVYLTDWVFDPVVGIITVLLDITYILVRKPAVRHHVKHHAKRVARKVRPSKRKKRR